MNDEEPTNIETLFKDFVNSRTVSRLRQCWDVFMIGFVILLVLIAIAWLRINYCEEKYPNRSIDYCIRNGK